MHAVSSYRGNRPKNKQLPPASPPVAKTPAGPITIHCAANTVCHLTQVNKTLTKLEL